MTKNDLLHIRVNNTVKETAEETLGKLGITISEAVNIFLCQINLTGGLPFDVTLPAPESVIVRSREELISKLDEAEDDIREGRTVTAEGMFARLRKKYDV